MGRKPDVSCETITRIHTLYKAGFSASQIVSETGFAKRTVERWLQRCREAPDLSPPFPQNRPGSSKRVTEKTLKLIKRQLQHEPTLLAQEVKENSYGLLGTVSARTVSRYIHDSLGLPSRRAALKPLLTARQMKVYLL